MENTKIMCAVMLDTKVSAAALATAADWQQQHSSSCRNRSSCRETQAAAVAAVAQKLNLSHPGQRSQGGHSQSSCCCHTRMLATSFGSRLHVLPPPATISLHSQQLFFQQFSPLFFSSLSPAATRSNQHTHAELYFHLS